MPKPMSSNPEDWGIKALVNLYYELVSSIPWKLTDAGNITPTTTDPAGTWDLWQEETPIFHDTVVAHNVENAMVPVPENLGAEW